MKPTMRLAPQQSQSIKLKTIFFFTTVSIGMFGIIIWIAFLFLSTGPADDAYAAGQNYHSKQSGNWTANVNWNSGTAPPVVNIDGDNIIINSTHDITLSSNLDIKNNTSL